MEKKKQQSLNKTYKEFFRIGLNSEDPHLLDTLVDDKIVGFGTAVDEKVQGIQELKKLLENQKIQSKGLELSWRNEPMDQFISDDENTAVFAEDLYLTINNGEENLEMYMRFSTVLNYSNNTWKVIHWHGSKPEQVESEKDTWGVESWKQKAEELERLVAEKTVDLEEKNRDLEVEAALERIRAMTMSMHSSEDVGKCILKMFSELTALGVDEGTRFGIGILNHDNENNQLWTARKNGDEVHMHIGNLDMSLHPLLRSARKAWKEQIPLHRYALEGEDLLNYYRMLNNAPDYKIQIPIEKLPKKEIQHCFIFEHGFFYAFTPHEFQPDLIHIAKRFSSLFEQTYRRYLDLVKAEAQAREAEIELALERVRARTMAMQKSDEMLALIKVLFDQLRLLGINFDHASFAKNLQEGDFTFWTTSKGQPEPIYLEVPTMDSPVLSRVYEAKKNGVDFITDFFTAEENREWSQHLIKFSALKFIPEPIKKFILNAPGFHRSSFLLKDIDFYVGSYGSEPFTDQENAIFKRFAQVFQQSYTRFLDLETAEAQARESEIQLALERVRARTMAMQHSEELMETSELMFEQIKNLGIELWSCGFSLWYDDDSYFLGYNPGPHGKLGNPLKIPLTEDIFFTTIREAKRRGDEFLVFESEGESLAQTYRYMDGLPVVGETMRGFVEAGFPLPTYQVTHCGFFSNGHLMFILQKHNSEAVDIFKRFTKVFNQTYTRFLDLQKAEAQAREAQIEAALERVRSRSLAMHKTDELQEVVRVVAEELKNTGVILDTWGAVICTYFEDSKDVLHWTASGDPANPSIAFLLPYFKDELYDEAWASKNRGDSYFAKVFSFDVKNAFFKHAFEHSDYRKLPDDYKKLILESESHGIAWAWAKNSAIMIPSIQGDLPSEDEKEILVRFARVFEQSFIRFLDLQNAEAQTREAKIEAALEKVRSRTMGMQSSNELPEVANLLFLEVQGLGIPAWSCGYCILLEDRKSSTCIMSSEGTLQKPFLLPHLGEVSFEEWNNFVQSDQTFFTQELGGNAIESHYNFMKSLPQLTPIFKDIEDAGLSLPTYQINHLCKFTHGFLLFITYEMVPKAHDIFKRFTKVFDQTYTRFLDLKKAEKQAREAQIENALEKVRSRSLAMQSPDELIEVAQLLREEMGALGVEELETSSIYIHDESSGLTQCWFTIKNRDNPDKAITDQMIIDLQDTWVGRKMDEFYQSKAKQTSILMQGEERIEWIRYCEEKSDLFGSSNFYGETIPDRTYHLYKFSNGYIGAAAPGEISTESWELLKRATAVFSFAYTRFMDLQMAEASARTAMRQASLDRVRAEISSMRNADDLDRITPLFFHELTKLGIPFIRCGVFIIQEDQEIVEAYLSSPDGNSLGVLRLPYQASELTYQTVEAWRKGVVYRQHWNKEDFIQWIKELMEQDQIQDRSTYQGAAAPPESLDLHFVPFAQGMLYVGAVSPLDEKELELVQALAKAFSIAYARYEDFVKLEQAKAVVESAMSELKATQSQLVQQEKLASLGQLTAGIAHEIKNPLNFVNNFSEVSIELIEEIKEERAKSQESRDESLVDEILEDIKSNLQKVHQHGSRANGIVTSMLQHSRGGSGKMEPTDLNALIKEYVNLSFHGMRAGKNPINVDIVMDLNPELGEVSLIKEDFTRVIINLCNNAFDAMRAKLDLTGFKNLSGLEAYHPKLTILTKAENNHILIEVADNGPGIPDDIKDKILQPFFTTKKGTEGTGLGLSITNDIIKAHGGELKIETQKNEMSRFIILLDTVK